MKRREWLLSAMASALLAVKSKGASAGGEKVEGSELIGQPAPPLGLQHWIHSPALEMSGLRGKVVLLRWWTQGCPFCEATAPALLNLQKEFGSRGLQVIGVYHPKPAGNWDLAKVEQAAGEKKFTFPIAVDGDWTALKRWWLTKDRDFTSVSFVVDRKGTIRHIHPGGEFHEGSVGGLKTHEACQRDYRAIHAEIERLVS